MLKVRRRDLFGYPSTWWNIDITKFPNGESHFDISKVGKSGFWWEIVMRYEDDSDIIGLIGLVREIHELNEMNRIHLRLTYFPYSRMDRGNESKLTMLDTMVTILSEMPLGSITTYEVHNVERTEQLFKEKLEDSKYSTREPKCYFLNINYTMFLLLRKILRNISSKDNICLVIPDKGAKERLDFIMENVNFESVVDIKETISKLPKIYLDKERDFETGKILDMKITNNDIEKYKGYTGIILDDLCSKGGTFSWGADLLEKAGLKNTILGVTHIEPTIMEGKLFKQENITQIYGTDSMLSENQVKDIIKESNGKVKIVNLESGEFYE